MDIQKAINMTIAHRGIKNKSRPKARKLLGFTLAEVLITLAVIGVVASMTIPALMNSTNKHEYVVGAKKAYSTLSQAYDLVKLDNGGDIRFAMGNATTSADFLNVFAPRLSINKNCGAGTGCWPNSLLKRLDGGDTAWNVDTWGPGNAILSDGMLLVFHIHSNSCTYDFIPADLDLNNPYHKQCGMIWVDVNGFKAPNQLGRDTFEFLVTQQGLLPRGMYVGDLGGAECAIFGEGCAAKVLKEGAMNY